MDAIGRKLGLSKEIRQPIIMDENAREVTKYIYRTFDRDFNDDSKYVLINDDWSVFGLQSNLKLHVITYQLIGIISLADLREIVYSDEYTTESYIHPMDKRTDFTWGFYKSTIEPSVKDYTDAPDNRIIPVNSTANELSPDMASILVYVPTDLRDEGNIERIMQYGSASEKRNTRVSLNYKVENIYVRPKNM
jgi:hypothetical protein